MRQHKVFSLKNKLCALIALCLFTFAFSAQSAEFVNKNTAVVRVMNKAAGKAFTVAAPVGTTTEYEKLSITVRSCKQTAPFVPDYFFIFAEISKTLAGKIFRGWTSRNDPGDNPLQD
ncbi:MAG: DUF2155 domain-containing protein, partial [Rickettsiales bacterium]|nr:DUF2155 domain-containing protein [Rickettsiales bacterium]